MSDDFQELVRQQNQVIVTQRKMMEYGYSIIFLPDVTPFGLKLGTGQWALCKLPTLKDDDAQGVVLFSTYDAAYDAAKSLVWQGHLVALHHLGTIHPYDLKALQRKI